VGDWDTQQGARVVMAEGLFGCPRVCEGAGGCQGDEGMQRGIELLDPSQ